MNGPNNGGSVWSAGNNTARTGPASRVGQPAKGKVGGSLCGSGPVVALSIRIQHNIIVVCQRTE